LKSLKKFERIFKQASTELSYLYIIIYIYNMYSIHTQFESLNTLESLNSYCVKFKKEKLSNFQIFKLSMKIVSNSFQTFQTFYLKRGCFGVFT